MFFKEAFSALENAAQHPLAVGMYIITIILWVIISIKVKRYNVF